MNVQAKSGNININRLLLIPLLVLHFHTIIETVKEACVEVDCISASWSQDWENVILNDVSFKVDKVRNMLLYVVVIRLNYNNIIAYLQLLNISMF
jgi:hypothetical protein